MLAEGSKMVVVTQPSAAQGVYGLVANLGGLVVRTAFQPFEEAAFTAFSTNPGALPTPTLLALRLLCKQCTLIPSPSSPGVGAGWKCCSSLHDSQGTQRTPLC